MSKEPLYAAMPKSKHIIVNSDACAGCLTCMLACSARHFNGECNPELSAIYIDADMLDYYFDATVCKQCSSASCITACRMGAMYFDEETGARCIDKDKCIGCGACVRACPYSSDKHPPIRKIVHNGKNTIVKCDLCHGHNDGPYCVQVCPKSAISIG